MASKYTITVFKKFKSSVTCHKQFKKKNSLHLQTFYQSQNSEKPWIFWINVRKNFSYSIIKHLCQRGRLTIHSKTHSSQGLSEFSKSLKIFQRSSLPQSSPSLLPPSYSTLFSSNIYIFTHTELSSVTAPAFFLSSPLSGE